MSEPVATFAELLNQDPRYQLEAYLFVQRGLAYAQRVLKLGKEQVNEDEISPELMEKIEQAMEAEEESEIDDAWEEFDARQTDLPRERHLTGQELCEGIRQFAIEQFGFMAKVVLNNWGVHTTGDFGEIVYNMIRGGLMKKSPSDRREDFDGVFDFEDAFQRKFRIVPNPAR